MTPAAVFRCPDCGKVLLIVIDPGHPNLPAEMETKIDGHPCPTTDPQPRRATR